MTVTAERFEVVVRGSPLIDAMEKIQHELSGRISSRMRILHEWPSMHRHSPRDLFVVAYAQSLTDEDELAAAKRALGANKRFLLFAGQTPVEAIGELVAALRVGSRERLHLARLEVDDELSYLRRLIAGIIAGEHDGTIMDAWWDADKFVVISPTFERLHVPVAAIPKISKADPDDRAKFQIDEYGDFVYWPSHDVHMGWSQFQQAINPMAKLRAEQKDRRFNQRYGKAVRTVREAVGLNQDGIAGLDARTVGRIERGETRATSNALEKLAKAHSMTATDYMAKLAELLPTG